MRNVELKARLSSIESAAETSNKLGARFEGELHQIDTYFNCESGRLKLREITPGDDHLVFYTRPDLAESKVSDYTIQFVDAGIKVLLEQAYGIGVVVEKVRSLWMWENVRIHLDEVKRLGTFIEFEAVLSEGFTDEDGYAKLERLQKEFGIESADILDGSYADLMKNS
jgi:predicted adenylyl cyclase CyaB